MTNKKRRIIAEESIVTDTAIRSDYSLIQVTLTLAVESFVCDQHSDRVDEAAIEDVLERFQPLVMDDTVIGNQIVVLHSDFVPLRLVKKVRP
jgi:hypothetical protein